MKTFILCSLLAISSLAASVSEEYVLGQNQFAFRLLHQFEEEKGNISFSPYSIGNALSLAYVGADGQTKSEIGLLFSYAPFDQKKLFRDIQQVKKTLAPVISSAEAVAIDATFPISESYIATVRDELNAEVFEIETGENPEGALPRINQWVSDKTKGFIPNLLKPNDINSQTKMVLLNAVYCKAEWHSTFSDKETKEDFFTTASAEKVAVSMMHKKEDLELYQDQDVSIVWKPMKAANEQAVELEAVIVVPNSDEVKHTLLQKLSAQKIEDYRSSATLEYVELFMPKCSIRKRSELKRELQALGMKQAFTNEANFSKIHPAQILKVQDVIHEAFMQMDEQGIEAAAATAVTMMVKSALVPTRKSIPVRCDKPFFVLLQEKSTKYVLFVSLIQRPEKVIKK